MRFSEYTNKFSKQAASMDKLFEAYTDKEATKNQAVADDMGVSRQYVNQVLKSGIRKIWAAWRSEDSGSSPFESFQNLVKVLNIKPEDYGEFFKKLPEEVRDEIEADAGNLGLIAKSGSGERYQEEEDDEEY